ncbi:hypothetical protein N7493_005097 [Penicillium malachiteum]|uniref:NWD NACHT-NTPase N-terminal domain-containing protein n=1 Tax=Penicillium malachiteum TaxID=1324776 RepID=A0AAD6HM29_9EURO|nr:hypothetical protein N7493_005097 [Penicillium malachiteum]
MAPGLSNGNTTYNMPLRSQLHPGASTKRNARQNPSETESLTEKKDSQQKASESTPSRLTSIPTPPARHNNLWERAEKRLKSDEKGEELLRKATKILEEWGLDIQLSGVDGYKKLCSFLEDQTTQLKEKQWVIGDQGVSVQDQVIKVMRNILVVKDVISTAAFASPPAAIACAAVSVSLLLFIQAAGQRDVLLQGLEKTSALILRIHKMDDLYLHSKETSDDFIAKFEETLTSLCCKLLEFQTRTLCYLQKNSFVQFSRGMLKKDPWDPLLQDMEDLENEARKFISLIEMDEMKAERERREGELQSAFEKYQISQTTLKQNEKLKAFFKFLYTCPYRDRKDRNGPRVPETCEWFTSHTRFREWNESSGSSLLWVSADPGCGKSVLAKYLVDEVLPKPRGRTVCYFFFKDDYEDQRSSTSAISSLLRQVLIAHPSLLPHSALEKFETDGHQLIKSFRELWNMLMNVSAKPAAGEIIFVIDALDECQDDDRTQLIEEVKKIYLNNSKDRNIKFLMTSRPYGHIRSAFYNVERGSPTIHLNAENEVEVDKISREIDLVIASRRERCLQQNIESESKLRKGKETSSYHHRCQAPLLVEELSLALAVQKFDQSDEEIREEIEPVERFKVTMRDLCGLLLVIIEQKVYLLHQTVKEFLAPDTSPSGSISTSHTWQNCLDPVKSSRILAEICIWVLYADPGTSLEAFRDYSAQYWMYHLRETCSCKEEKITELAALLWDPEPLIAASYLGLVQVVEFLLDSEETVADSMDWNDRSSLSWAAEYGHEAVVQLLLQNGQVNIDSKDFRFKRTPLSWAAEYGQKDVVKLLLETGKASINSKDSKKRTPLSWAAEYGQKAVVDLVLQTGKASINLKDSDKKTALSYASEYGHEAVVKLLLQTGQATINPQNLSRRTPLSQAAENGHEAVVELLLQTGKADINSKDITQKLLFPLQQRIVMRLWSSYFFKLGRWISLQWTQVDEMLAHMQAQVVIRLWLSYFTRLGAQALIQRPQVSELYCHGQRILLWGCGEVAI